jgi:hypothetical protein
MHKNSKKRKTSPVLDPAQPALSFQKTASLSNPATTMTIPARVTRAFPTNHEISSTKKTVKIISGGQTGVDFIALELAHKAGLETGGVAAQGFKTEDCPCSDLEHLYKLRDSGADYVARTKMNVDEADATIAFLAKSPSGTGKTIGYAQTRMWKEGFETLQTGREFKPVLVVKPHEMKNARLCAMMIKWWLSTLDNTNINKNTKINPNTNEFIVNIAGHRASVSRRLSVEYLQQCRQILELVFSSLKAI